MISGSPTPIRHHPNVSTMDRGSPPTQLIRTSRALSTTFWWRLCLVPRATHTSNTWSEPPATRGLADRADDGFIAVFDFGGAVLGFFRHWSSLMGGAKAVDRSGAYPPTHKRRAGASVGIPVTQRAAAAIIVAATTTVTHATASWSRAPRHAVADAHRAGRVVLGFRPNPLGASNPCRALAQNTLPMDWTDCFQLT